jgi:hypothetical protein
VEKQNSSELNTVLGAVIGLAVVGAFFRFIRPSLSRTPQERAWKKTANEINREANRLRKKFKLVVPRAGNS